MKKKEPAIKLVSPLPQGIELGDLSYPTYTENAAAYTDRLFNLDFELWYTERFGWAIPTLHISSARRADLQRRTYAVAVNIKGPGALLRLGNGPHVKQVLQVYVSKKNLARLQPFIDKQREGQEMAGETRDRISTRRAQTAMRRRDPFGGLFR